jgi:hypothetical protein
MIFFTHKQYRIWLAVLVVAMLFPLDSVKGQSVTNVSSHVEGVDIVINYDLSEKSNVSLSVIDGYNIIRAKNVTGDVGRNVKSGKNKSIRWSPLDEYNTDSYRKDNIRFKINTKSSAKTFILGEFAYSPSTQYAGGIMAGMVWKCGWYVKFHSSFNFTSPTDGLHCQWGIIDGVTPFYNGNVAKPELIADLGFVCKMKIPLYLCIGLGYGYRNLLWQTVDEKWVRIDGYSYSGVSTELCLMGCIKGFTLMMGVNTINFKYMELQFGVGWMF